MIEEAEGRRLIAGWLEGFGKGDKIAGLRKWIEGLEQSENREHHKPFIVLLGEKIVELENELN